MSVEKTILSNLIFNDEYCRRVIPYLKSEYFNEEGERKTFVLIDSYILKYNRQPTPDILTIDLQKEVDTINEAAYASTIKAIEGLENKKENDAWLLETTEAFCKEKALFHG